ncbi:MAG TPA: copper amine oxidase N-terminal domain-containing protein [Thermoanaerobacterales bacterium]|nr:copper amine oxidase N-terminal domain-containing protein [Thermoanaerobacterales bacterium]
MEETRTVIGTKENVSVTPTIDSNLAKVNRTTIHLDFLATIIDGKTFVSMRFIS